MQRILTAVRMWTWALVLRPLKHVAPFSTLLRLVHVSGRRQRSLEFEQNLEAYMMAARRFPARAPANCLERSLAAYRLLCVAGSRPEVLVGVRRGPVTGVEGHVWVTLDGRALAERQDFLDTFAVIVSYDADGRQKSVGPAEPLAGARFA